MWMIVGLGNPGTKYALTRHNVGFMAADLLLQSVGKPHESTDHKALVAKFKWEDESIIVVKPQAFMNRSGESVQPLMNFYKVPPANLIVVHDEVDLPFGTMKIQQNRGPGGHNGIKDISLQLGTNEYTRVRLGVGRPANPQQEIADFVLSQFSKEELKQLPDFLNKACDAIEMLVFDGYAKTASQFNG
ncbi:MAG: aminoacyl-tRNA hydrolase [Bdellovibrionaceae bacterium]|nr:aminoacyl-tRNA hydrolase [Pseudobdellovibrionaceae bacterium]